METLQRITANDVTLGEALPWPLYDVLGGILFRSGQIISSRHHLDALLSCGLYRGTDNHPVAPREMNRSIPAVDTPCFFDAITQMPANLRIALDGIKKGHAGSQTRVIRLARSLQQLCNSDHDAALGLVHLFQDGSYPVVHLLHTAILCELISERVGYQQERRVPLICATLTSNISIIDLQERLHAQSESLTREQVDQIKSHPQDSAHILQQAGITGALWLQTVLQHHERVDGSGYGKQLCGDDIHMDARIVAIADIYTAMITPRDYRDGMPAKDALRELFLSRGKTVDQKLSELFIKELGVYPPGTFVELVNGEQGIVTRRGREHKDQKIAAILGPMGERYANPIVRSGKNAEHKIRKALPGIPDFPLNLKRIWGIT